MAIAVVTGGANGIGRAICEKILSENIHVACLDCDEVAGKALENSQENLKFYAVDITQTEVVFSVIQQLLTQFGSIDYLINNAAIYHHKSLLALSASDIDEILSLNIRAHLMLTQACLPSMLKKQQGHIVFIGSDQSFRPKPNGIAYAATKGAIHLITQSLALEYAQYGVEIHAVYPSAVKTAMTEKIFQTWADEAFQGDLEKVMHIIDAENPEGLTTPQCVAEEVFAICNIPCRG